MPPPHHAPAHQPPRCPEFRKRPNPTTTRGKTKREVLTTPSMMSRRGLRRHRHTAGGMGRATDDGVPGGGRHELGPHHCLSHVKQSPPGVTDRSEFFRFNSECLAVSFMLRSLRVEHDHGPRELGSAGIGETGPPGAETAWGFRKNFQNLLTLNDFNLCGQSDQPPHRGGGGIGTDWLVSNCARLAFDSTRRFPSSPGWFAINGMGGTASTTCGTSTRCAPSFC